MDPTLKFKNLVEEITRSELMNIQPAVQLLSLPINSQLTMLTLVFGNATIPGTFYYRFFGNDLNDNKQFLRISPPFCTRTMVSISL